MTVTEICTFACTYLLNKATSFITDSTEGVNWVNEWQEENVDKIKNFNTQTLSDCTSDTWYSLDSDCAKIYEVRDSNGDLIFDYKTDLGQILFAYNGTYTVKYYQMPTAVTDGDDSPDCHALFHKAIAYWLAYKKMSNGDPTRPDALPFKALYEEKMTAVLRNLQKRNRVARTPLWR